MGNPRRLIRFLAGAACLGLVALGPSPALATGPTVTGAGSTWVQIALDQWRADIAHQGYSINYQGVGSSAGRTLYQTGSVDFAASEIPFTAEEANALNRSNKHYQYMPDVAGGTSLMYNLHTPAGARVTSLKLNADVAAKIFTGVINKWSDPQILALNPGLQVRETRIITVVRSDGSGTSAQFSLYLADQAPGVWQAFVAAQGCPAPCSNWPPLQGFLSAPGSDGVANAVATDSTGSGAIAYVEAGYAYGRGFPVAWLRNASGNFTQPTSENVATALTHATLYGDLTQNLTGVYRAPEPSAYPMSSYSYMILPCVAPATVSPTCSPDPGGFDPAKGAVLGTWIIYIACAGQRRAAPLGYSPLPLNLVQADMAAVNRIPGHPVTPPLDYQHCPNPNLASGGISPGPTVLPSAAPADQAAAAPADPAAATSDQGGAAAGSTGTPSGGPAGLPAGGQPSSGSGQPGDADLPPAGSGDSNVEASTLASAAVLPAGAARVTLLDATQRREMLDGALAAATRTQAQAPSRGPLWIALATLLALIFLPTLLAAVRGRTGRV